MRYDKLTESTGKSVRDLNLLPDFWKSVNVKLNNQNLISLDGCPDEIIGNFLFWDNHLTSLVYSPKTMVGDFNCWNNLLTSLEHSPPSVGGDFNCGDNQLTSLVGGPENVGGSFDCSDNHLTSLAGCPKTIGGDFDCINSHLTSLADIHTHVQQIKGKLYIGGNPIIDHILGVLLVRGCRELSSEYGSIEASPPLQQAIDILNRYLGRGREGIMECQAEMLAAGLDDFAQI